jgi:hypothetical protein
MLSDTFSIVEFLDKAKYNNYQVVLTLAHREVTDVERFLYKKQNVSVGDTKLREYATVLKDFISFMRYGIKTRKVRPLDLEHFKTLREMSASIFRR